RGRVRGENVGGFPPEAKSTAEIASSVGQYWDADFDWDDLKAMRDRWPGKMLVKGILRADEAERLAAIGVDAVVVSNHGGRQLDGAIAGLDALPTIVRAGNGRVRVRGGGGGRGRGGAVHGGRARRRGRDAGPRDALRRGRRWRGGRAARARDPARRAVPFDAARGRALDFGDRTGADRSSALAFPRRFAMASVNRRLVLKGAALGALAYTVGAAEVLLSPREAYAQNIPLKVLTADERAT